MNRFNNTQSTLFAWLLVTTLAGACTKSSTPGAKCFSDATCTADSSCVAGVCQKTGNFPASCSNQKRDGDESDIDCGGSCAKCQPGKACRGTVDCADQNCKLGICQQATCTDGIRNGTETDVDCGGSCGATCALGKACKATSDCKKEGACVSNRCGLPPQIAWAADTPNLVNVTPDSCALTAAFTAKAFDPATLASTQGSVSGPPGVTITNVTAASGALSAQLSNLAAGRFDTSVTAANSLGQTNTLSRALKINVAELSTFRTEAQTPTAVLSQDAMVGRQALFDSALPNACKQQFFGLRGSIAVGGQHACVLTTEGKVNCWGYSLYGQAGTPITNIDSNSDPSPIEIRFPREVKCKKREFADCTADGNALSSVVSLAAGQDHTCALTSGGTVKCWGRNSDPTPKAFGSPSGQLGVGLLPLPSSAGFPSNQSFQALDVCDTSSADAPCPRLGRVVAIAAGDQHTCALSDSGTMQCWGLGQNGQLGNGKSEKRLRPVDVCTDSACSAKLTGAVAIAAGANHTCAVTAPRGEVLCWGSNSFGQLGNGETAGETLTRAEKDKNLPGLVICGANSGSDCKRNDALAGVIALAAGARHTCALLKTGGVKCWGLNAAGQLGLGTGTASSTPVTSPVDVRCGSSPLSQGCTTDNAPLSNVIAISAGETHTCGQINNGGLVCWGSDASGRLGIESGINYRDTPKNVVCTGSLGCASSGAPLADVIAVSAGKLATTCALTSTGAVKCWGDNQRFALGNGDFMMGGSQMAPTKDPRPTSSTRPLDVCASRDSSGACTPFASGAVRSFKTFTVAVP